MYKILNVFFLILMVGCNLKSKNQSTNSSLIKTGDSSKIPNLASDTRGEGKATHQKDLVSGTDSIDDTPTPAEERKRLSKSYNDIKVIDTTFIENDGASLHFHLKYYCLKGDTINVPNTYTLDENPAHNYITYGFASDVLLINNHDTVLNKQFKASTFNPYFKDNFGGNLKKYGSILMPELSKRNKDPNQVVLIFYIAIPTTDISTGVFLVISKSGSYKILENY
jgi:hypothetical protein